MANWIEEHPEAIPKYNTNRREKRKKVTGLALLQRVFKEREIARQNYAAIRKALFKGYGKKCKCCGEKQIEFLTLDHINGGGTIERKQYRGDQLIKKIIKDGFPKEYQILCFNCNWAKHRQGICPHNKKIFKASMTKDWT